MNYPSERLATNESTLVLYRAYNPAMELLCVGVFADALERITEHKERAPWVQEAVWLKVQSFETRKAAEAAALEAIRTERPKYNIASGKPYADEARQRALALLSEPAPDVSRIRLEQQHAEERGDAALSKTLADFITQYEALQAAARARLGGAEMSAVDGSIRSLVDAYEIRYPRRDPLRRRLKWWLDFLGQDRAIATINKAAVWSGVAALQKRGRYDFLGYDEAGNAIRPKEWRPLAPATVLAYIGALQQLLNWANRGGLLPAGWVDPCREAAAVFYPYSDRRARAPRERAAKEGGPQ